MALAEKVPDLINRKTQKGLGELASRLDPQTNQTIYWAKQGASLYAPMGPAVTLFGAFVGAAASEILQLLPEISRRGKPHS